MVIIAILGMTGAIFYFLFISWNSPPKDLFFQIKIVYMALWIFFVLIMILFFINSETKKSTTGRKKKNE